MLIQKYFRQSGPWSLSTQKIIFSNSSNKYHGLILIYNLITVKPRNRCQIVLVSEKTNEGLLRGFWEVEKYIEIFTMGNNETPMRNEPEKMF